MFLGVLSFSSLFVPSLTAGSVCPLGGGCSLLVAFFCVFAALKDSECGILMPSGLLVWQIPYREMRSLGLKVSIRRGSRLPCLVLCGSLGARHDLQLVRAVPDSTGGFSWT